MTEDWIDRWNTGRTGWHESQGNAGLHEFWPVLAPNSRVLVPLCGKSPDLKWLALRDCHVVGIELAQAAVCDFFAEQEISYRVNQDGVLDRYIADELPLEIHVGNYFDFSSHPFDALYDRGALVALTGDARHDYVRHTRHLLKPDAKKLVVTLDYDQSVVNGPPFAVNSAELSRYWADLREVGSRDDLATCPPKFRAAGLKEIREVFWLAE